LRYPTFLSYRSHTIASICSEAQDIAQQGIKELVLISQDSTIYGWDLGLKRDSILVRELAKTEGIEWIL
jgi:ribosomal protein S12 methylthiotransferase